MALVDYPGSEDSDQEEKTSVPPPPKTGPTSAKPAFQKVVNSSNPHKIRIALPELVTIQPDSIMDESEPPAKRAKVGLGGFSGFNSFLPEPKRLAPPSGGSIAKGTNRGGLGRGINLKTGATPGFTREPVAATEPAFENGDVGGDENAEGGLQTAAKPSELQDTIAKENVAEVPKKKIAMFKPLSVAQKPRKKNVPPTDYTGKTADPTGALMKEPKAALKVSLFSVGDLREDRSKDAAPSGIYQPLIYHADNTRTTTSASLSGITPESSEPDTLTTSIPSESAKSTPQSLSAIATDLNLSASAKRQLLGRQKDKPNAPSNFNIVNFNTDQEYAANETLRQAGEQVQHNPVRAIAPGKHSLKQLVNAATNQKDALEEQFASGRRNKKEAGSKYGW